MASQNVKNPDVKPQDIQRAQVKLTELVRANRKKKLHLETLHAEYAALTAKLETLPQKFSHQIMVPFAGVAFMPGQIQHTNEITVLLGDNWFMQCTASHAAEIAQRRQKRVENSMAELDSEFDLVKGSLGLTNELKLGTTTNEDGFIEIREFEADTNDAGLAAGSLKLPTSGTAPSASASAPPKIQVLSSSDINEDDLYRVPEGMENDGEDDYDSDENDDDDDNDEDSDTYYDDFDDEEIEASLALAARTQPTALPTVKSSGSSQKSPAPAARQSAPLPQVVSSSATARPSQQVQRTVIPPSISQAPAPVVSKSKQAQKPNVSAAPKLPSVKKSSNIVVTERDVVAPPLAPALSSQEDVPAAPIVVEEEPKRVSRFKQMQMRAGK